MKKTPKEKAKYIFQTIYCMEDGLSKYPMCFDTAKQASLFLIDEVLEATVNFVAKRESTDTGYENVVHSVYDDYWIEVRKELENL